MKFVVTGFGELNNEYVHQCEWHSSDLFIQLCEITLWEMTRSKNFLRKLPTADKETVLVVVSIKKIVYSYENIQSFKAVPKPSLDS